MESLYESDYAQWAETIAQKLAEKRFTELGELDLSNLMSDTVIRVENLGKKYIIGHQKQERYTSLRDVIANGARSVFSSLTQNPKLKILILRSFGR